MNSVLPPLPPGGFERRLHVRHGATTFAKLTRIPGRPKHEAITGRLVNLSIGGCSIRLRNHAHLRLGSLVKLVIVPQVGNIAKPHHRWATVRHITHGLVGFSTELWTPQSEKEINSWLKK